MTKGQTKAGAHLAGAIEGFLLSRRVGNCSSRTFEVYAANLRRFQRATGLLTLEAASSLAIPTLPRRATGRLKPISIHQHYRCLRTFFVWCVEADLLQVHPMHGLTMKAAKTLPTVPEDDTVRRLLAACPDKFEAVGTERWSRCWPGICTANA